MEALDAPAAHGEPARKTLWAVQDNGGEAQPFTFVLAGYGDAWSLRVWLARWDRSTRYTASSLPAKAALRRRGSWPPCMWNICAPCSRKVRTVSGGYSAGAVMALEIAIQLRAKGETVGLVALLDPLFIRYTRFEHLSYHALQVVCRAVEKIVPTKLRVLQILAAMFEDEGLDTHLAALAGYKPDHYPGHIVFYCARWAVGRSPLLVRQWKWFTRAPIKVETVPGDHHTFIRPPHVKDLSRRLVSEIRTAVASGAR